MCFSVRNMTRDKVHVSKQNIPEYNEIRLFCDYEYLCWVFSDVLLLAVVNPSALRPRTELTKYNYEKNPTATEVKRCKIASQGSEDFPAEY